MINISNLPNVSIQELEVMQQRALRELVLHLVQGKTISSSDLAKGISVLKQVDDEIARRRAS